MQNYLYSEEFTSDDTKHTQTHLGPNNFTWNINYKLTFFFSGVLNALVLFRDY